jgi:hypothetical protein
VLLIVSIIYTECRISYCYTELSVIHSECSNQEILTGGGRLSTVDLLIKVACFVKKENNKFRIKRAYLN